MNASFEGVDGLGSAQIRESRRHAVQLMYQVDVAQQTLVHEQMFHAFFEQFQVAPAERPFVRALVQRALARQGDIDAAIEAHSKNWKLSRIAKVDLAVLRVATLELMERRDTAVDIIIADAVEIGKQYGARSSSAFINGVLDGITKTVRV